MEHQRWVDGNGLDLVIESPHGPLFHLGLGPTVQQARCVADGEILRFTYDLVDPEDGTVTSGAARIVLQDLPDPRTPMVRS